MRRRTGATAAGFLFALAAASSAGASPGAAPAAASVTVDAPWFGGETAPLAPGQIELAVVSGLPSTVTGENARVEVRGLQPGDRLRVDRDGADVTSSLAPLQNKPGVVNGVVGGLRVGVNHMTATATGP